jgi:hypothetical protein
VDVETLSTDAGFLVVVALDIMDWYSKVDRETEDDVEVDIGAEDDTRVEDDARAEDDGEADGDDAESKDNVEAADDAAADDGWKTDECWEGEDDWESESDRELDDNSEPNDVREADGGWETDDDLLAIDDCTAVNEELEADRETRETLELSPTVELATFTLAELAVLHFPKPFWQLLAAQWSGVVRNVFLSRTETYPCLNRTSCTESSSRPSGFLNKSCRRKNVGGASVEGDARVLDEDCTGERIELATVAWLHLPNLGLQPFPQYRSVLPHHPY